MQTGIGLIENERMRQVFQEGYTAEHDDVFEADQLSIAAACYAVAGLDCYVVNTDSAEDALSAEDAFPWGADDDKREQHSRLRRLVIAGALIAAEIDRLLRAGDKL